MISEQERRDFVQEATAWLEANAKRKPLDDGEFRWGEGPEVRLLGGRKAEDEDRRLARAREWRAHVFDAGFGWLGGPVEYGGGGRDPELDHVYRELESEFQVPDQSAWQVAWEMVAPAVLHHGSEDLKQRFLRPIMRGELLCSQLLSEPSNGSDLAGLTTRAVRDGDEWIVNGQKVWNSYAHKAQIGQLMARTDPTAPKHAGITMFLLDLSSPGVEVRPLKQMTGDAEFNEVFLTDVRVPHANIVGEPGGGWRAVLTTLMSERAAVGGSTASLRIDPSQQVLELARHVGADDNPLVRQRLAEVYTNARLLRMVAEMAAAKAKGGAASGSEGSILKLLGSTQNRRIADLAGTLLGPKMLADTGEWGTFSWAMYLCGTPAMRIAGGTDEIQRNILAERILGLPKEPMPAGRAG